MSAERKKLTTAKRWVVKIGSALLTDDGKGLSTEHMDAWVAQLSALRSSGIEVVLVSSGSVAEGMSRLGWQKRPDALHQLQAAAAVGQMGLVQAWESRFARFGLHTAQVLLGHDDISARDRYLNARSALQTLLELGVVPVVNENDTVVTDEIRFGDNDTLAALVANLLDAEVLLILTDQNGLFDADPRNNPSAKLIEETSVDAPELDAMAGGSGGGLGRGGMQTKLSAARLAARSGAVTVIAGGRNADVIQNVAIGKNVGTLLYGRSDPLTARKKWLVGMTRSQGVLELDDGAVKALRLGGRSLLPVGVKRVSGRFKRGDLVVCRDGQGVEVARGLSNYSADEAKTLAGKPSEQIAELLGYNGDKELVHCDNLVVN